MFKTFFLKLTSALLIDGVICRAGEIVEVSESQAKNFLYRGKAEVATVEELKAAGIELPEETESEDLSKLTKEQLLEICKERGVEIGSGATKAQIIEAIEAAMAANGNFTGE